ncbi:MAG TPA: SDR family oxidoreductase, partial [Longimicrobiaceae bacterium]|nr:SDR family oxidoreductase [Longimicrobiaceae bacterium]
MENQDHSHAAPVYEPQEIAGRTVVISGGTTGIGRATARLLAAHGARVLIFGRHEEELNEALEEIRAAGGEVYGLTADQSRLEDVQRVFEEADHRLGDLDILINNAAVSPDSLLEGEPEELRYAIETNLGGPIACTREAARRMQSRGEGHIVTIGSMSADLREEENSVYVATKAALQGFSESLRKTLNP